MRRSIDLAKANKNDEFYTRLEDIEKELKHYRDYFKDKVVYCNADDPRVSNFFHYFSYNFEHLGLKKLITTCYKNQEMDLFSMHDYESAIALVYEGEKDNGRVPTVENIGVIELRGDGDFRSPEAIEFLKEADIVVTNPPFSLFREYMQQIIEFDKKFIVIGSQNATTYREIFPLIKENKIWLGHNNGVKEFIIPGDAPEKVGQRIDEKGIRYQKFGNIVWYTNLDIQKRHEDLILYKKYNQNDYPTYDNYDAIEVNKTANIPYDFKGIMGVPITFLDKYNPEQFEIIELSRYMKTDGMSAKFVKDYYASGQKGQISEGHPDLCYYDIEGRPVVPYMRILIKNKKVVE